MVEKKFLIEKIVANYLYDGARFTTDELSKELRVSKRTLYEIFLQSVDFLYEKNYFTIRQESLRL